MWTSSTRTCSHPSLAMNINKKNINDLGTFKYIIEYWCIAGSVMIPVYHIMDNTMYYQQASLNKLTILNSSIIVLIIFFGNNFSASCSNTEKYWICANNLVHASVTWRFNNTFLVQSWNALCNLTCKAVRFQKIVWNLIWQDLIIIIFGRGGLNQGKQIEQHNDTS